MCRMHLFLIEKAIHWQDSLKSAVVADTIMPDGVNPNLLLFTTDLNVDLINLTFDEVVQRFIQLQHNDSPFFKFPS